MMILGIRRTALLLPLILMMMTACLPQRLSQILALPQSLTLTGRVLTSAGEPASDVLIFVGDHEESKAMTASDGTYKFVLDEADLVKLKGGLQTQRDVFYLFFQRDLPVPLVGVSAAVEQNARGNRQMEDVRLDAPAVLKGLVQVLAKGRKLEPAHQARVRIGRYEAFTSVDGSFELTGLPAGRLPLTVSARDFAAYNDDVNLNSGMTNVHGEPIVLFDEPGITGALIFRPGLQSDYITSGHPFLRTFYVTGSRAARYLRFSHQEAGLEAANWIPVRSLVDYDFPSAGGHTLYYQFCDAARKDLSPIYQSGIVVDLFADANGLTINDGAGVSQSPQVMVSLQQVPVAAYRMRVAEKPEDLLVTPWGEVRRSFLYTFDAKFMSDFLVVEKPFLRQLYLQFEDVSGTQSIVYATSVLLDLFRGVRVVIGPGPVSLPVINSRLAPVTITGLTPLTTEMRMADDYNELDKEPWRAVRADEAGVFSTGHLFGARFTQIAPIQLVASGPRRIRVQFRDAAHFVSPTFEVPVLVDLFPIPDPSLGPVFTINGGDPVSNMRLVEVQVNHIPSNAKEMRLYERDPNLLDSIFELEAALLGGISLSTRTSDTQAIWQPVGEFAYYYFQFANVSSNRILYLQFRDGDQIVSSSYQQIIHIDPTFGLEAGVILDGGALTSNDRIIHVTLIPPPVGDDNISSFKVYEGYAEPSDQDPQVWNGDLEMDYVTETTTGPIVISAKYNLSNNSSITVRNIIIMNVPPPPPTP